MEKPPVLFQYETHSYSEKGQEKSVKLPADLKLDPKILRPLSKLSKTKLFSAMLFDWGLIFLVAYLQWNFLSVYFYPVTLLVIASRQQALGVILHDASHFLLLKNRKWNDLLADWLLAFPLNLTVYGYRREHFAHHKYSGLENDPDRIRLAQPHYQVDKTSKALIFKMIKMCSGFYVIREFYEMGYKYQLATNVPWSVHFSRGLFVSLLATAVVLSGLWLPVLLFWFVPMMTVLMPIVFIRLKAEHDRIPEEKLVNTRTVIPNRFEQFFISQHNVNFHLDHHIFPSVPFYHLPKLHQELLKVARYQESAHISRGYFRGLWRELTTMPQTKYEKDSKNLSRVDSTPHQQAL